MDHIDFEELAIAMGDLNENKVMEIIHKIMEDGGTYALKSLEAFQKGMDIVSERYDACEYFVGDLIFAGELMTQAVNFLSPALKQSPTSNKALGKVIICTVEGDLHDIGKNIVKTVLSSRGIDVIDLGVNVSPSVIVEQAIAEDVHIIALSGVLHFALVSMRRTAEAFEEAGMRDKVRILVGGACINEETFKTTNADAWTFSPSDCADLCCKWLEEFKQLKENTSPVQQS